MRLVQSIVSKLKPTAWGRTGTLGPPAFMRVPASPFAENKLGANGDHARSLRT